MPYIMLVALLSLTVDPAHSTESFNGHRFMSQCLVVSSDHDGEKRFAECGRFVHEVRQLLANHTVHGQRACIPASVPDIQLLISGTARIQSVPEQHDREAREILAEFFAKRWPCAE